MYNYGYMSMEYHYLVWLSTYGSSIKTSPRKTYSRTFHFIESSRTTPER